MALPFELPVFTDTNFNTYIAMSVSPNTTVGDLKRKLRREHFTCFPNLGQIRIHALMVKRKSCFYHLPDSMPIKNAFQGLKGTWFLRMDATCIEEGKGFDRPYLFWLEADAPNSQDALEEGSKCLVAELGNSIYNVSDVSDCLKREHITCTGKNNLKGKASRRWRDDSACFEDLLKGLMTPVCNSRKRRKKRLKKGCNLMYVVNRRSSQDDKMGACVSERDKSLDGDINDETILAKHSFGSGSRKCIFEDTHQGKLESKVSQQGVGVSLQDHHGCFGPGEEVVCREERARWSVDDPTNVSSSEIISVTGIITRYFSEFDEVNTVDSHKNMNGSDYDKVTPCSIVAYDVDRSNCNVVAGISTQKCSKSKVSDPVGMGQTGRHKKQRNTTSRKGDEGQSCKAKVNGYCSRMPEDDKPERAARTSPSMLPLPFSADSNTETRKSKPGRTEIGNRFLLAANDLGISTSKRSPLSSIYSSKGGKLSSLVRNAIFEISGGE